MCVFRSESSDRSVTTLSCADATAAELSTMADTRASFLREFSFRRMGRCREIVTGAVAHTVAPRAAEERTLVALSRTIMTSRWSMGHDERHDNLVMYCAGSTARAVHGTRHKKSAPRGALF